MTFHGSICALVTPFQADGSLDLPAFGRLLDRHLAAGTHAVVVAGSTGESASIDDDEYDRLVEFAQRHLAGRIPVIAGCGAPATHKALRLLRRAEAQGVAAVLAVTPYYTRPTQEGLYRHFSALADAGRLPVIVYNVPARTGCDLLPETVARLLSNSGIVGVKEARAERERMRDLLTLRRPGFVVLSGDDPTGLRAMLDGADGIISVAANVCPVAFRAMVDLARSKRPQDAQALDAQLATVYRAVGLESNPIPSKWILHRLGLCQPGLRLPLHELSPAFRVEAEACVETIRNLESHYLNPAHGGRAA